MERSARTLALALGVEAVRDRARVRVDLDHGAERRSLAIERVDPREVLVDERSRGLLTARHALLELRDGCLFQVERRGPRGCLRGGPHRGGGDQRDGEGSGEREATDRCHVFLSLSAMTAPHTIPAAIISAPITCTVHAIR